MTKSQLSPAHLLTRVVGALSIALAFMLTAGTTVSAAPVDEEIGTRVDSLVGVEGALWDGGQVRVCFEPGGPADTQSWLEPVLSAGWEAFGNVDFTGFGVCTPGEGGVRVAFADGKPQVKAPGRFLDGIERGVVLNSTFANWDGELARVGIDCSDPDEQRDCFRYTANPVFGYVLGFTSEARHPGSDTNCELFDDAMFAAHDLYTPFDEDSVMAYCQSTAGVFGFTPTDAQGLRAAYGPWTDENPLIVDFTAEIVVVDHEAVLANEVERRTITDQIQLSDTNSYWGITKTLCAGDEVRLEASWELDLSVGLGETRAFHYELFEGTSCSTDDRVFGVITILRPRLVATRGHEGTQTIENTAEWAGGDWATVAVNFEPQVEKMLDLPCTYCAALASGANKDPQWPSVKGDKLPFKTPTLEPVVEIPGPQLPKFGFPK